MPFAVKLSESTAARRRIPVYLVDVTDRITPETGIAAPTIEWSKNGGGQSSGAGNWGEVGDGIYYYEFTTGEIDTLGGGHTLRVVKAGVSAEFVDSVIVTAYDPYDSAAMGMSRVDVVLSTRAVESTVAKEATLGTKIPTNLSFTGANVNAESKVTAAPADMALNSTVSKDSTVAKEATLGTKIPTNLSFTGANVNSESKVTAAPTDMALNSTVAKDSTVAKAAGTKGLDNVHDDVAGITGFALDSTVAKENTLNTKIPTALSFTGANVNSESKVTAAPTDMALNSTVSKEATVAKAAGAKGTDAIYDDVITHPILTEIEASTVLAKQADVVRALGLMQENQYIDTIVYTLGKVTSMRLRTYDTKANVGTGTGVVATYTITANYTGDVLNWFKAVKE